MLLSEKTESLKLGSVIVIFDRDLGASFFQDLRVYGNLLDDAEWLLERTPQRSWGIMIRPIMNGEKYGLWIGEYGPHTNRVISEEMTFDKGSSVLSRVLFKYAEHGIDESKVRRIVTIDVCKRRIRDSKIVQRFKYYRCPEDRFYKSCERVEEIYKAVKNRYGSEAKVHYSHILDIILNVEPCEDALICPFLSLPNPLERIINLNKALRSRKIGEIKIVNGSLMQIT